MKATAKDLRFHAKEILDVVSRGEEVIITYRGKPCAKIIPIDNHQEEASQEHSLFGIWQDHTIADVNEFVNSQRKGRFE